MEIIVDLIDEVISDIENDGTLRRVGEKVLELVKPFPLFSVE